MFKIQGNAKQQQPQNAIKKISIKSPCNDKPTQNINTNRADTSKSTQKATENFFEKYNKQYSLYGGAIEDAYAEFDGTKDSEIGDTRQKANGNCWFLSGINALSYTEKGAKAISDALEYHDGSTTVHLKGAGDYTITDEKLQEARDSQRYSSGDDDMIILELATEKLFEDYYNGNVQIDDRIAGSFFGTVLSASKDVADEYGYTSHGGVPPIAMYLLTGKVGGYYTKKGDMSSVLDRFTANGNQDLALSAGVVQPKNVTDVFGNTVQLAAPHAYAVKSVEDDIVYVTNPIDTSDVIVLSKDDFIKSFDALYDCDLSENSSEYDFIDE